MTIVDGQFYLKNLWRRSAGLPELEPQAAIPSLEKLRTTEWSPRFETLMRNRLIVGAIRYGKINDWNKPEYDRVQGIYKRLCEYALTGNLENLVDIANLALVEFEEGRHPKRHFKSIDDGEHVQ